MENNQDLDFEAPTLLNMGGAFRLAGHDVGGSSPGGKEDESSCSGSESEEEEEETVVKKELDSSLALNRELDDDEDDSEDDSEEDEEEEEKQYRVVQTPDEKKYQLLLERCEAIQQDNERLVSRICEVRHLCRQGLKERRMLMSRLDGYGDNYRNVPIVMPPNEEESIRSSGAVSASAGSAVSSTTTGGDGKKRKPRAERKRKSTGNPVGRPKKHGEVKDPNLPKRPQNPFFQFCKRERSRVHSHYLEEFNVNLSKKELTKILAQRWNDLGPQDKQAFTVLFEQEKQQYKDNLTRYKEALSIQSAIGS